MSNVTQGLNDIAKTLDRLTDFALDTAKKLGADAIKIASGASFEKRLVVENKQFSLANSLDSRSFGLVVHKDQKKGSASINTVTEEGVKRAIESALALAKYSVPDENLTLPGVQLAPKAKPLDFLYDDSLAGVELGEIQAVMQEVLARLTRDKRVALDRYEMSVNVSYHGMANSLGVRQSERQTMATWSFFGMARDGEEVTGFDWDGSFALKRGDMLGKSMEDAGRFVDKIVKGLGPVKCPSYKGAVLLSPRAVQELIVGMIQYHVGGRQVMDGKSRWEKSLGEKVLSEHLTLRDHPHDPRFSGCTAFDGDGLPTAPRILLDKGVLKEHLHDCYSAKKCKAKPTGTSGGPFACEFTAGSTPLADLLAANGPLLLVDRFSGNEDPVKGDFSGVAKSSRLFQGGKDMGPVAETMIAGNFFEMARAVLAVSREAENVGGGFLSPYILFDGVSVSGAD